MSVTAPIILGIETSSSLCSVCFWSEGRLLASVEKDIGFGHASVFFELLAQLESQSGYALKGASHVAVTRGPGSFTGIRVGLSIAKGISMAGNLPLLGLTVFDVVRYGLYPKKPVCIALDTKRQDFYGAVCGLGTDPEPAIFTKDDILSLCQTPGTHFNFR